MILMNKKARLLRPLNEMIMKVQYCLLMLIFFIAFVIVSVLLIPIAWVLGIGYKIANRDNTNATFQE